MNYAELSALGLTKYGLFTHCVPDSIGVADDGFGNLVQSPGGGWIRQASWFWFWKSSGEPH